MSQISLLSSPYHRNLNLLHVTLTCNDVSKKNLLCIMFDILSQLFA